MSDSDKQNPRISKVTTKGGDRGTTKLATGRRVAKSSQYVRAVGAVDELNSHIGLAIAAMDGATEHTGQLLDIQQALFEVGAVLAMEGTYDAPTATSLESAIERYNTELPDLKEFVLPRGTRLVAQLHVCRAVCRRAEVELWSLTAAENPPVSYSQCAQYLNRLSDLFFVLARWHGQDDELEWRGPG